MDQINPGNAKVHGGVTFHHPIAFWIGTLSVAVGVGLHVPMVLHSVSMGYKMAGMPWDAPMLAGMLLILGGLIGALYGLIPNLASLRRQHPPSVIGDLRARAIDDAPLTLAHWKLFFVLVVALIIDVMKPATLGFIMPGTIAEYGLPKSTVAMLPLVALTGTAIGSVIWGVLADIIGRRASILLAAVMFVGTAVCGAMPTFAGNVIMCFLMGISAGGLLPITFALLAETVPARHRGWLIVLLGGIGTVGGYLAASGAAALLEPTFGWRALWLLGLPTGIILIALNRYIPESPRFLIARGRDEEASSVMRRFGVIMAAQPPVAAVDTRAPAGVAQLFTPPYGVLTLGLTVCGVAWGLVNFGFLLWLPTNLRELGLDAGASAALLAKSALIAFPGVLLVTWLYHRWSTKKTLVLFLLLTAVALLGFAWFGDSAQDAKQVLPVLVVALLISSSGVIAMLVPYGAEIYPVQVRATGTGLVAGSSKFGGIAGVGVGLAALAPGLTASALIVAVPVAIAALILGRKGVETRGRALDEISALRPALPQREP